MSQTRAILFRLWKITAIIIGVFTIAVYAAGSTEMICQPNLFPQFITGLCSLFFILCAGYLMNDLCDIPYDSANCPEKVFIGTLISRTAAKYTAVVFFVMGLASGIFVNLWYVGIILLVAGVLVFYNLFSKRLGMLKDIMISLIVISIYPIALALTLGGKHSPRRLSLFIFPIWLFMTIMSYEMVRDIIDARGDGLATNKSLPLQVNRKKTRKTALIFAFCGLPFAYFPFVFGMCGTPYVWGFSGAAVILASGAFLRMEILSKALFLEILIITVASLLDILIAS
jgi:4-hydroxybenzoate polyprenyltransferase